MWLLPAQSRNNFLALDRAPPSPGACKASRGECVCAELCGSGHRAGGQGGPCGCWGAWGCKAPRRGAWRLCRGSLCKERGGMGSVRAHGEDAAQGSGHTHGWHVPAGVSAPFCVQRAVPRGRREQPWADSHRGGPPEQRLSAGVVWLGHGKPWVSEGCAHPWDNKG